MDVNDIFQLSMEANPVDFPVRFPANMSDRDFVLWGDKPDDMKIFDDTTAAMFSMVFSNLNENERLIHLRDSLLPKLMSGAIDVSELDL